MTSAQPDAPAARFPDLAVRSLAGDDLVLPRDLMAPRALLICAFRQWHQQLVDKWITWATTSGVAPSPLDLDPASSSVVLELPVVTGFVVTRDGAVLAQVTGPADPSRCAVVAAALVSGQPA